MAAVCNDHIFADHILPVIHTVLVIDFLHTEGDKYRKALCGKGTQGVNLADTKGQGGIQSIHLLIFQYRKLAQVLSGGGKKCFRIIVKLLFRFCRMHHCQNSKHHPLVTGRQIVQKFLAFLSLLFKVVGNNCRKVIVLVLLSLPVCDVGFHT